MTHQQAEHIKILINSKGFDYVFQYYSNFEDIEDKEFHKLRKAYLKASKKLESYVENAYEAEELESE